MQEALNIAKYILKHSSKGLSNLELQKILYFAELNYIREYEDFLIEDDFEAWQYGPVLRKVYNEYKNYGADSIDRPQEQITLDEKIKKVLDKTMKEYADKSYWDLVDESHKIGGAWFDTFKEYTKCIIPKERIRQEAYEKNK